MSARRALVTGAAGFLGSRLVEMLTQDRGWSVVALIRNAQQAPLVGRFAIDLRLGDLADQETVNAAAEGCEVIFHCAHDDASSLSEQANLQAARSLANAAGHRKARLVYVSSAAVYGDGFFGRSPAELDERAPDRPSVDRAHATSKLEIQRLLKAESGRLGFELVVLHPTLIYGPYSKPWVSEPLALLKKSWLVLPEGGRGHANLVFVDDVARALVLAAEVPAAAGERFLISGRAPCTWAQFYGTYEALLGRTAILYASTPAELRRLRWGHNRQASLDLIRALADQSLQEKAERIPAVDEIFQQARQRIPKLWTSLRGSRERSSAPVLPSGGARSAVTPAPEPPRPGPGEDLRFPNPRMLALYRSQVRVSSAKAGRILGYRPGFEFEQGMEVVSAFARWANLV